MLNRKQTIVQNRHPYIVYIILTSEVDKNGLCQTLTVIDDTMGTMMTTTMMVTTMILAENSFQRNDFH